MPVAMRMRVVLDGDLGEDDAGVEPPTFRDEDGVVAELVGEDGGGRR